jgi:hypothetical protein
VKAGKEVYAMRVIDISTHGMKLQIAGDTIMLKNSDRVACSFKAGTATLELQCTVVRTEKTGKTRTLWNFGMDFPMMAPEDLQKLKELAKLVEPAAK